MFYVETPLASGSVNFGLMCYTLHVITVLFSKFEMGVLCLVQK